MTFLSWIGVAAGALLAAGLVERTLRDRALRRIPIRVHVNGTRGKSTVTRLVAAALRAHGVRTLAKVTGTEPRLILPDGNERAIRRRGPANIREQLRLLSLAHHMGASALVVECMAIRPDLQWSAEHDMIRATLGIISNVRTDHTEVMGTTLAEIAASLAGTVPRKAVLVLGGPPVSAVFAERAAALGSRVVVADPRRDSSAWRAGGSRQPAWLAEDMAVALAATRELGVPDETAVAAMLAAAPDPGASRVYSTGIAGCAAVLLDARAANDPESFELLLRTSPLGDRRPSRRLTIYNHRGDRPDRLRRFAPALASPGTVAVLITGDRPPLTLQRELGRAMAGRGCRYVPRDRLLSAIEALGLQVEVAVLCGNTRGLDVSALRGAALHD